MVDFVFGLHRKHNINTKWRINMRDRITTALLTMSVLNEANLQQHVVGPTHVSEHTLDLVITSVSGCSVTSTTVSTMMSDHNNGYTQHYVIRNQFNQ